MDVKKVFRGISSKLQADFALSSEINHQGSKGIYRENTLRNFLLSGRLPKRFGIGTGEIIGHTKNVSKQIDLIIYDQLDGISFMYSEDVQVYPIESVCGIIEVKSKLSKTELIKSLRNIKSVKSLCPRESDTTNNSFVRTDYLQPRPFRIVFAYSLSDNSLESLLKNLKEWESENEDKFWPDLVVILNEGIIFHLGQEMQKYIFSSQEMANAISPLYLSYRKDTLFYFYSKLIDLCGRTSLCPVNLERYFDPAEQIGNYVVRNHYPIIQSNEDILYRLSLEFIDKVVQYSKKQGKIKCRDLFIKQMGNIPPGMDEDYLDDEIYHYDPEGLPGIHEIGDPFHISNGRAVATQRMLQPSDFIEVDGERYYFPLCYREEDCIEPISGSSRQDL